MRCERICSDMSNSTFQQQRISHPAPHTPWMLLRNWGGPPLPHALCRLCGHGGHSGRQTHIPSTEPLRAMSCSTQPHGHQPGPTAQHRWWGRRRRGVSTGGRLWLRNAPLDAGKPLSAQG